MTADETHGRDAALDPDPVLDQARRRCQRLLENLQRDARALQRPLRHVPDEALAEGRLAYDRAAAAAQALLQRLDEPAAESPPDPR